MICPFDRSHATRIFIAAAILLLALHSTAPADGGFIHPYGHDIWEPSQSALILYDDETETEDMILHVEFFGDTKDFGWIVPVPSLPDLDTADPQIFRDCAVLTAPIYRNRGTGWGCSDTDRGVLTPDQGRENDIDIYNEETVGIFNTLTLGASDAGVLADSLNTWGYLPESERPVVEAALQFYIDKSWYFVAMRMDSTSVIEDYHDGYWYGMVDPIRLTFQSEEIIYPLRISAISARDPSEIQLYVCASHRMTFPGARTEYANDLDSSEFSYIRDRYEYLGPLLKESYFITKLRKYFYVDEMTDDLILERAATDDEFRRIHYSGNPPGDLLLLAMVGIVFVGLGRLNRRKKAI